MSSHETERFSRYDTADYLKSEADIAAYLDAVIEDGDPALIAAALEDVTHARSMFDFTPEGEMARNR